MAQRSFWLVAGPALAEGSTRPSKERTVGRIKHVTQLFADSWDFNIPNLKVGSFDTLMSLSDDLIKIDHFVENVTRKIGTQIYSLVDEPPEFLSVDQANTDTFLKTFNWDEGRFNTRMGCRELADRLQSAVSQIDDEFRGKMNDYSNIASAVTQTQRKRGGTLMVKDFSDCVNPASMYDTDMLKTIFVVVPKYKDQEWQTTYETLVEFSPKNDKMSFFGVVPRSANVIESDNEYVLYDVTVMKRCLDDFKSKSRERGFVVRELHQEEGEFVSGKEALQKLLNEKERQKSKLLLWCKAHFAQCFTAWIHLKSIRVHVECFLRYGFPANFVTVLLQPHKKNLDKKIHASLETLFAEYSNQFLKDTKDDDVAPGLLVAQEKFYPYVFLEINLDMANESR